ncbi:hypothetical protein [Streptomyces sp. ISL-11]|uniref:hypothetical protein n=1 Tax=Streptomyces sp. ISL-11 TaxID=2819174 RepID=UPI001BE6984F|nr:hypothetical protein [Streptomyces sp. ISL-11]MBT2387617.1 hypothetical protein [Streptomyces sp. ISL-11]
MTRASAPIGTAFRVLLMAGGGLVILLGIAVLFFGHARIVDMAVGPRLAVGLVLRGTEAALVWGGVWCCVRGWNGGREPA